MKFVLSIFGTSLRGPPLNSSFSTTLVFPDHRTVCLRIYDLFIFLIDKHQLPMRGKQHLFFIIFACLFFTSNTYAGLNSGTLAADFSLTDINGKSFNLSELNAQGKSVILNFSSSWSPSSWAYDKKNILNNLNNQFGENGSNDVVVLFIETDPTTNLSCLKGEGECSSSSMGDWTSMLNYSIIDLQEDQLWIESLYSVTEYPTLYGVSKNGIVENMGQAPESAWLEWMFGEVKYQASVDTKTPTTKSEAGFSFLNLISTSDNQIEDSSIKIEALPSLNSSIVANLDLSIPSLDSTVDTDETFDTTIDYVHHHSELDGFIASLGQSKLMYKNFNLVL